MTIRRQSITLAGQRFNFSITPEQVADAVMKVTNYSFEEKTGRFDDIYAAQPALLGAAVQLPSLGVDLRLAEHALHVLLVLFECFSECVPMLPKIAPEAVQKAFDDIASMLRFYDGESEVEARRLQEVWVRSHREQAIVAFVVGYLHSELRVPTRHEELVRNCCLAITNAYLAAYEAAHRRTSE